MSSVVRIVSMLLALFLAGSAGAQEPVKYANPEKFERATSTDDKGLTQWADYVDVKCAHCAGTGKMKCATCERLHEEVKCIDCQRKEGREVACHACAGTGSVPDPLLKVLCAGCKGASFLLCTVCSGGGMLKIGTGAKNWSACPGCRGTGGFKCGVCAGDRVVDVAAPKPSLRDANPATLQKAIAATNQALTDLAAITPAGGPKARKEVKALIKALEPAQSVHPAIKKLSKAFEDYMGKIYGGANFEGHEENEAEAMNLIKTSADYYLKHQKRMMELALKRAEANAAVEAAAKGK